VFEKHNTGERQALYRNIASTCESGWDFSSRFMRQNETSLSALVTTQILPVDLNSLLCASFSVLARAFALKGSLEPGRAYNLINL